MKKLKNQPDHGFTDRTLLKISEFMAKIPAFSFKNRWILLFSFTLITAFLFAGIGRVKIDQSFDTWFKKDDPDLRNYKKFRYFFGSNEFVIIMYEPQSGDIFSEESLKRIKKLEDILNKKRINTNSKLSRITRIRSILSADYLENKNDTLINRKFIGNNIPKNKHTRENLRKLALAHKDYPGNFFSKDSKFGTILLETDFAARVVKKKSDQNIEKNETAIEFEFDSSKKFETKKNNLIPELERQQMHEYAEFSKELEDVLKKMGWKDISINKKTANIMNYVIAGQPWVLYFFDKIVSQEMGLVILSALFIIMIAIWVVFKSLPAMLWPTLIMSFGIAWTLGLVGWLNITMSSMMNILILLGLTVGIAPSLHILSGFKYYRAKEENNLNAMTLAYKKSGLPVFLAALTTIIGLLSLTIAPIIQIRNFGIAAAMIVLFPLMGTLFLLPILMSFWAPKLSKKKGSKKRDQKSKLERFFQSLLQKIYIISTNHPGKVITIFSVMAVIAAIAYPRIKIDTNQKDMIKAGYGIRESYQIIDKNFGGAASVEIVIDTKKQDGMKDPEILIAMDQFSNHVLKERKDFATRSTSLVNAVKESYKNLTDGTEKNYKIPKNANILKQTLITYDSVDPATRRLFVDDDWEKGRISFQVISKSSTEYKIFLAELNGWVNQYFEDVKKKNPGLEIYFTGAIPLMTKMQRFISELQIKSFAIVLFFISIILFLLYNSIKLGFLALLPNIFPIGLVFGVIGWLNIPLGIMIVTVIPIAISIAVDDTIHFLTHYKTEILRGHSNHDAIRNALSEVGQAIIFTSLVLSFGFLIFMFSGLTGLSNFGLLSMIAIITALMADLFLLPSLLVVFSPFRIKNKMNKKISAAVSAIFFTLLVLPIANLEAKPILKNPQKAKTIAKKMINRNDGTTSYNKIVLLSCYFTLKAGKKKCSSKPRKKVFEMISKDVGKNKKDSISLSLLISPASEKGVAFLQKDYDNENKNSDQWMYLPALKKLKRIVSGDSNSPKTGSFFGSEIAFEDLEQIHLADYHYSYLGIEIIDSRKTYVLEATPGKKRAHKTSYGKNKIWIDKQTYMVLKSEAYSRQGKLIKTFYAKKLEKIKGIWVNRQFIVVNHTNNRMSMMKIQKIAMNIPIATGLLSPRAIKDSSFRESKLAGIRKQVR